MSGRTHAVIGANAIWITLVLGLVDVHFLWLTLLGALGGLLPDIDATYAKIHYVGSGIFKPLKGLATHRGFFHSLLMIGLLFILSLFLMSVHPAIPFVLTLAYASHPLIDGLNKPGVAYLYPSKKRYRLIPKKLCTPVGGIVDELLFVFGLVSLLFFFLLHHKLLLSGFGIAQSPFF